MAAPAGYTKEEWDTLKKDFENDLKNVTMYSDSFIETVGKILEEETEESFTGKTGLSKHMFKRVLNRVDQDDPLRRSSFISFCIGYGLNLFEAQALLHSLGLAFDPSSKRDLAYSYLLTRCKGKTVDECNEILMELGIEEKDLIGIYARNTMSENL